MTTGRVRTEQGVLQSNTTRETAQRQKRSAAFRSLSEVVLCTPRSTRLTLNDGEINDKFKIACVSNEMLSFVKHTFRQKQTIEED